MEKIKKKTIDKEEIRKKHYNLMMEFFQLNKISPRESVEAALTYFMSMLRRMDMSPEEVEWMFNMLAKAYREDEFE